MRIPFIGNGGGKERVGLTPADVLDQGYRVIVTRNVSRFAMPLNGNKMQPEEVGKSPEKHPIGSFLPRNIAESVAREYNRQYPTRGLARLLGKQTAVVVPESIKVSPNGHR